MGMSAFRKKSLYGICMILELLKNHAMSLAEGSAIPEPELPAFAAEATSAE